MKKVVSLILVSLLLIIITRWVQNQALADGSQSGLVSYQEYVLNEQVSFEGQMVPVQTQYVVESYAIPQNASTNLVVTQSRSIASWRQSGNMCYLFNVQSKARTQANTCVSDEVYVKVQTKYPVNQLTSGKEGRDTWGCKDDTGWQSITNTFAQGTNNIYTRGSHRVKHNGTPYDYPNIDGPSTSLPYERACTG